MKHKQKFLNFSAICLSVLGLGILSACSSKSGSQSPSPAPTVVSQPLTIDTAGTVPVIGNNATTSVIYVHNNTNIDIKNVTYTTDTNVKDTPAGYSFISQSNAAICSIVPAKGSCALTFTTPSLAANVQSGSSVIKADYIDHKGKERSFSQVVSYNRINDNSKENGAKFNSSVVLNGYGNGMAYSTVYLYGTGNNKIYTVNSITSDNPGVVILNGNITGDQLPSYAVQAVEIGGAVQDTNVLTSLVAKSSLKGAKYSTLAGVSATPSGATGIMVTGDNPIVNTSVASPSGTMFYMNAGNQTAPVTSVTVPTGVTKGTDTCTGQTIAVGGTCSVAFTVANNTGGSGTATLNYTGTYSSISRSIVWYAGKGAPLLAMVLDPNPLTFNATTNSGFDIVLTNIGGVNLTDVSASTISNSGNILPSYGTACATINVGASCTITNTVTDSVVETNKNLVVAVTASNGGPYSRQNTLVYNTTAFEPNLVFAPNPANTITINGNNLATNTQTITVTNSGLADATSVSYLVTNNPNAVVSIDNTTCTASLASGASCDVTLKYGPKKSDTSIGGNAGLQATYSGGSLTAPTTSTGTIPWAVSANNQSLDITNIAFNGASPTGTGSNGDPFIIMGNDPISSVTLTVSNAGTNTVNIKGVSATYSAVVWLYSAVDSTCLNAVLAPGDTCTVQYNYVLADNTAVTAGLGSQYLGMLTAPSFVFTDSTGSQFFMQPNMPASTGGDVNFYINNKMATITNSVTGTTNMTVSSVLANATGYGSNTVSAQFESYFVTDTASAGCTVGSLYGGSIINQSCVLTPDGTGTNTQSVTYNLLSGYTGDATIIYGQLPGTSGQIFNMSPLFSTYTMP